MGTNSVTHTLGDSDLIILSTQHILILATIHLTFASACTINTHSHAGGSCDFSGRNPSNKCGYTFNGFWKVYSGSYSYIGTTISGARKSGKFR